VITISFNGAAHDPARRAEVLANAKTAMGFLKGFGANMLVVFSPNRAQASGEAAFRTACECYNELGAVAKDMGFRAGLHNHMGQMVQDTAELDRCMAMTDPKLFWLAPDTAHMYLAGIDVVKALDKYRDRLMMADYKDARHVSDKLQDNIFDLGDGEIDFPGCHRVLKSIKFDGWLCVDLDTARQGPRVSYERCGAYVVDKLEPIYA
jgi:sugar phosphate isomerase/epimerase